MIHGNAGMGKTYYGSASDAAQDYAYPNTLNDLAQMISEWRFSKGFLTPAYLSTMEERDAMLGKLMLVVTEVAEAAEAVRGYEKDEVGALENFKEELADTLIRVLDICGTMAIDIESVLLKKMAVNATRPPRHGKSTSL